jgi:16S rRNA processing protein RimM
LKSNSEPEYLILGQIVAPFGVRGAVKATIYTEFPERVAKLEGVVLAPFDALDEQIAPTAALDPVTLRGSGQRGQPIREGNTQQFVPGPLQPTKYGIESASVHKGQLVLKLAGVDSIEGAEGLRGYWVLVPREQAKHLPRGSYYLYQLVGLDVYDTEGKHIGQVSEVITAAANDVYVVRGEGVTELSGELLVPAIKGVVKRIDPDGGRMVIAPVSQWA